MSSLPWTDARVETLKTLWLSGLSAAQVAAALGGVTRNAVIGKLHRLGMAGRGAPSAPRPASTPRQSRAGASRVPRRASAALTPARPDGAGPLARRAPATPELAPSVGMLEQLAPGACRWPIGDPQAASFGYCGRPRSRGPYCAEHAAHAYRGAPARLDRDPFVRRLLAGAGA